jgi:hypothetical protein
MQCNKCSGTLQYLCITIQTASRNVCGAAESESATLQLWPLTLVVCEVQKEFRDEASSGGPWAPQTLQVALTQIAGIDGILQGAIFLFLLLLVMKAVAICCRDGHSDGARNEATFWTEGVRVSACSGPSLNITRALLRLVGGLPSHFFPSKGIFISLVTDCNSTLLRTRA